MNTFYEAMQALHAAEQAWRNMPAWVAESPRARNRWLHDREYQRACLRAQETANNEQRQRLLDLAEGR